jgi:hypothetical protein
MVDVNRHRVETPGGGEPAEQLPEQGPVGRRHEVEGIGADQRLRGPADQALRGAGRKSDAPAFIDFDEQIRRREGERQEPVSIVPNLVGILSPWKTSPGGAGTAFGPVVPRNSIEKRGSSAGRRDRSTPQARYSDLTCWRRRSIETGWPLRSTHQKLQPLHDGAP